MAWGLVWLQGLVLVLWSFQFSVPTFGWLTLATPTTATPQQDVATSDNIVFSEPAHDASTSADWFMRNLRSFTIDVGNNPNVDGTRYFATNTGTLQDVRVIGNGKVGINAGFLGQSGPNLVDNVIVEGYETGILSQWIWGETISRATIRNCR